MARIVSGPYVAVRVVAKQTGTPISGVTVTVSPAVYTTVEMTSSTTTLTTDGAGVFVCYALPGTYTFTTTAVDAAPIEPVEILGAEGLGADRTASGTYAPINSPTFTGTPVVPGYLTTATAATTYAGIQGHTRYVDPVSGLDTNSGKSWSTAYRTIAAALADVQSVSGAFGTIYAGQGTHDVASTLVLWSGTRLIGTGNGPAASGGTLLRWTGADDGSPVIRTAHDFDGSYHDWSFGLIQDLRVGAQSGVMTGGGFGIEVRNAQNSSRLVNVQVGKSATDSVFAMPGGGVYAYSDDPSTYIYPGYIRFDNVWCVGGALPWRIRAGYTTVLLVGCATDGLTETTAAFTLDPATSASGIARGGRDLELTLIGFKMESNYINADGIVINTDSTVTIIGGDVRAPGSVGKSAIKYTATPADSNDLSVPSLAVMNFGSQGFQHWLSAANQGLTIDAPIDYTGGRVVRRSFFGGLRVQDLEGSYDRRAVLNSQQVGKRLSGETLERQATSNSAASPAAGNAYAQRVYLRAGAYTTATFAVINAGTVLANTYVGLYDSTWTRLAVSADVSTTFQAAGAVTVPLAYTVTVDGWYYLAFLVGSATTVPQLAQGGGGSALLGSITPAVSAKHNATGLTALPAPLVPTTTYSGFQNHWIRYEGAA